jgi:HlyD family secretion protein
MSVLTEFEILNFGFFEDSKLPALSDLRIYHAQTAPDYQEGLARPGVKIVALGSEIEMVQILELLEWLALTAPMRAVPQVYLCHELPDSSLRHQVSSRREIYWVRPALTQSRRVDLIRGALEALRHRHQVLSSRAGTASKSGLFDRLLGQIAARVKEDDRPELLGIQFTQALKQLIGPVDVQLFRVDHFNQQLIRGYAPGLDQDACSQSGLPGFALRTNRTEVFLDCENDPCFEPDIDGARQSLIRHAILAPMHDLYGEARMLVYVSAPASQWPDPHSDRSDVERFTEASTAFFLKHLYQESDALHVQRRDTAAGIKQQTGVYRAAAVQAQQDGFQAEPVVLEAGAGWTKHTYRLLLLAACAMLLASILIQINQYASGWGVVRTGQKIPLQTTVDGNIEKLHITSGSSVSKGALLLELNAQNERSAFDQAQRRFQEAVRARLLNLNDVTNASQLPNLRAAVLTTQDELRRRQIFSPADGFVSDLRLEAGQFVVAGQHLFDITQAGAKRKLMALLPGSYRPQLSIGQPVRVKLSGYAFTTLELKIARIGDELVGPTQARRLLGAAREDAFPVSGSNVWIEADIEQDSFRFNGRDLSFHDGLSGEVEIVIDRAPIALQLGFGGRTWR